MTLEKLYKTTLASYGDVLTVKEVQEVLGVGRTTVYALIESGQLHGIKPGKRYLVPKYGLLLYLTRSAA